MAAKPPTRDSSLRDSLIATYAINDAMNQLLLGRLDPRGLARATARWRQQGRAHHCGDLRAFAQLPAGVAQELRALFEMPGAARSRPLHDEASRGGASQKRSAVPAHAARRARRNAAAPPREIFAWELGADLGSRRRDVLLHVFARGASSWTDPDARASARLPLAAVPGHLALGKVVEAESHSAAQLAPLPWRAAFASRPVFR
jgi:hypothetical protein